MQNTLHLTGVVAQGDLFHTIRSAEELKWTALGDVKAAARSNPGAFSDVSCAGDFNGFKLRVCGVLNNGRILVTIRKADGNWEPFEDVKQGGGSDPGQFVASSCAILGTGAFHIVAATTDGRLWHTLRQDILPITPFEKFGDVKAATGNDPGAFVDVTCASDASSLHVCGVTTDGRMWHAIRNEDKTWTRLGDVKIATGTDPGRFVRVAAAEMLGNACLPITAGKHVCGLTEDGRVWHTIRKDEDGTWSEFGDVKAATRNDPGKFVDLSCWGTTVCELNVAGATADGRLWHTIRRPDGDWSPFGDVKRETGNDPGAFRRMAVSGIVS